MILFVDACAGASSRTRRLAFKVLENLNEEWETLVLYNLNMTVLNEAKLTKRTNLCKAGSFSDSMFELAKQFARADTIVIAAPFWDLSFPTILKQYIENVCVSGITFKYSPEGVPIGLCKAENLYYVTTAGGRIYNSEFGFGYIKALAQSMFGIKNVRIFCAEELDIIGNDVEKILTSAETQISSYFSKQP